MRPNLAEIQCFAGDRVSMGVKFLLVSAGFLRVFPVRFERCRSDLFGFFRLRSDSVELDRTRFGLFECERLWKRSRWMGTMDMGFAFAAGGRYRSRIYGHGFGWRPLRAASLSFAAS